MTTARTQPRAACSTSFRTVKKRMLTDEIEPIVSATMTACSLPTSPSTSSVADEEARRECRLSRVARICVAQIRSRERSLVRIGRSIRRLVVHYNREHGLTALAAKITQEHGKIVSRQYLGQALLAFESYTEDERENRFSDLTDSHLLKAAQGFPNSDENETRNEILDRAVKNASSVAELVADIKTHKASKATADTPEPAPTTTDAPSKESRGYVQGDGPLELASLSDGGVGFLRVRETVVCADAISEAGRVLSDCGLMIVELPGFEGYFDVAQAVKRATKLKVLHAWIATTSSAPRNAPHNLPVVDRFRVLVLVGRSGFRNSQPHPKRFDNPMSDTVLDALIYSLVPDSGLVVDIGIGCVETASWAKPHDREYLAVELDANAYERGLADLETNPDTQETDGPPAHSAVDLWPMVSASQREQASIKGKSWDDFTCCDRTVVAVVVTGVSAMTCPSCRKKRTAKHGAPACS